MNRYFLLHAALPFFLLSSMPLAAASEETIVQQVSANGTRSLRPFTVQDQWELRWDLKGQSIEVYLKQLDGEFVALTPIASQKKPGPGSTFYPKGGSFYLRIIAEGDWTTTVVQLSKVAPTPLGPSATNLPPQSTAQTILALRDFTWSRSKYGSLFAIFTIENSSESDVKDFTISCSTYGQSGTQIGTTSKTFYEIVKAKSMLEYAGVEIGPVHSQTAIVRCQANSTTRKP